MKKKMDSHAIVISNMHVALLFVEHLNYCSLMQENKIMKNSINFLREHLLEMCVTSTFNVGTHILTVFCLKHFILQFVMESFTGNFYDESLYRINFIYKFEKVIVPAEWLKLVVVLLAGQLVHHIKLCSGVMMSCAEPF